MSARSDRIILTFFGSGYFPVAPGTAGSLASLAVGAVLWFQLPETFQPWLFPLLTLLSMAGCVLPGDRIQEIFGRKDPGAVVIDEAAGQYAALSVLPWLPQTWTPWGPRFSALPSLRHPQAFWNPQAGGKTGRVGRIAG
ncbi:MAG: phosphatidylglycerophosphatase A [Planctomycetota bacterium]